MIDIWTLMLECMAQFFGPLVFPLIGISLFGGLIVCCLNWFKNT